MNDNGNWIFAFANACLFLGALILVLCAIAFLVSRLS